MNRDRLNRIILVVVLTGMAVAGLYSTLISWLNHRTRQESALLAESGRRLGELDRALRDTREITLKAKLYSAVLQQWRLSVPQGAAYRWLLRELERVAKTNGVTEFTLGGVSADDTVDLPSDLNYQGVKGTVVGVGAYQQLGMFVADFENAFPFNEVMGLTLDVAGVDTGLVTSDQDYPVLGMQLEFRGCGYEVVF